MYHLSSSENVEELFEKHFDLFKKVPTHLCELFYDKKLEEWNDIISESDPRIQPLCNQIGSEVKSSLFLQRISSKEENKQIEFAMLIGLILKPYPFLRITRRELVSMLENT